MDAPTGPWDADETERFLRAETAPIRVACHTPSGGLWMLSLWYLVRDGTLWCTTSAGADVVGFLRGDDRVAFEVSTNDPPYRGVRGNGSARIEPDPEKATVEELIERYLDGTGSPLARKLLAPEREEVRIGIEPARLHTWDFTDRMGDAATDSE